MIVVGATVAVLGVHNAFKGATENFGREFARLAFERRSETRRQREASRLAKAGRHPLAVLSVASIQAPTSAHDELAGRLAPTPLGSALIAAIESDSAPFKDRTAILIGVGSGSAAELDTIMANTGRKSVRVAFAVDPSDVGSVSTERVVRTSGDLWTQLENAMNWAGNQLTANLGDFVAVILSTPITGSWDAESDVTLRSLMARIFANDTWDIWFTCRETFDASAWPERVKISFPVTAATFRRMLRNVGIDLPRAATDSDHPRIILEGSEAALLVITMVESTPSAMPPKNATQSLPQYGAEVTLALETASKRGRAHVERDDSIIRETQAFLDIVGIRITSSLEDGVNRILPLSCYPGCIIAWKLAELDSSFPVLVTEPPIGRLAARWLTEAIQCGDESIAAAILADHGRAWIEGHDWAHHLEIVRDAGQRFPRNTRAHLWAHYLLALDSALRLNQPNASWFDDEACETARMTELSLLFRVERMEFRRLRGDLAGACAELNQLLPELAGPSKYLSPAATYSLGTSCFVAANTLRRGGRYDKARELIDAAAAILNSSIPAHHVELTHCSYAISICDSIHGIPTVRSADEWEASEAVFARSLVTLSNSHASWFVEDYSRAIEFAQQAHKGFNSIGYSRYASRAEKLASLLSDWARRCGRSVPEELSMPDIRVNELLSVKEGSRIDLFANERPSRALSLLQFTRRFLRDPAAPRTVLLPPFIGLADDNSFTLYTLPPSRSYQEAEQKLRGAIGVGSDIRVPLAAD